MTDFRFRLPSINDLTDLQQVAFYEPRPVLVTGGPGSGKTVVSVFRYLRQITTDQNAMFFTFNRTLMSAIRGTLRQQADLRLPGLSEDDVEQIIQKKIASMFEWYGAEFHQALSQQSDEEITKNFATYRHRKLGNDKFSEIFIDESQDLRPGVLSSAYEFAHKVSCGADRAQDLQGHYAGPADDIIYSLLQAQKRTIRQGLTSNFRNTKEIFEFARQFVPEDHSVQDIEVDELPGGEMPEITELSEQEQLATVLEIIRQNPNSNIGILVHFKSQILKVKEHLEQNGFSCGRDAACKFHSN